MLDNETRLKLKTFFEPSTPPLSIIERELIKVNASIERKWSILDDFSVSWSYTQWKNFKDGLEGEMSYREYLKLLHPQLK